MSIWAKSDPNRGLQNGGGEISRRDLHIRIQRVEYRDFDPRYVRIRPHTATLPKGVRAHLGQNLHKVGGHTSLYGPPLE